jgi:phosphate transport system substrate-binding protein
MRSVISAFSLLIMLAACGPGERQTASSAAAGQGGPDRPVTVKGSDTMVILGQRLAEEYMKRNPGAVVQVNGGGSGTGIAALINGTVDLAQSSRSMKDDEKANVETNRKAKVVETPVALDALSVFVHQSNPVKNLTIDQVAQMYTGKVKNWSQVGGKNAPIVLYGRESSSGTYDYFKEHVLSKQDFAPSVQTLQGTAAIINAVSKDPNGIGYGGIAYAKDVRLLGVKKDAASPAIEPSEATVANKTYPLSRELYFYSLEAAPDRVKNFIAFAVSPEGQALVTDVGYFPVTTESPSTSTQGNAGT